MALPARFRGNIEPDPIVEGGIKLFSEDPEYQRLRGMAELLCTAKAAREAARDIRSIDVELRQGLTSQRGPRAELLRERRAELQARLPKPKQAEPVPEDAGWAAPIGVALRLLRGDGLPPRQDRPEEMARLANELVLIDAAIRQLDCEFDELRQDRSAKVARGLLAQHNTILKSKYDAALKLAAAVAAERALITAMIQAGYLTQPGVLRSPPFQPAAIMGNPEHYDSLIATYRRALEACEVL